MIRLDAYCNKMVHDLFDGTKGFAIDGGIKDSTHIRKLAAEVNSPMPALVRRVLSFPRVIMLNDEQDTAHQHLLTARALYDYKKLRGDAVFETLDWSSLVAGTRVASGLDGFDSKKVSAIPPLEIAWMLNSYVFAQHVNVAPVPE